MQINNLLYQQILWRGLSIASLFLLNILFARIFDAAASGAVFFVFTICTFIVRLVGFSLESGVGYFAAQRTIANERLIGISIVWTLLGTILVTLLYVPGSHLLGGPISYPLYYPLVFVAGNLLISFGNAFYFSQYNFITPNAISTAINVLLILFLLLTNAGWGSVDFVSLYFFSFLLHGVVLFVAIIFGHRMQVYHFVARVADLRKLFRYSSLAFITNLVTLALMRIDYVFVKNYCSDNDLGIYIQVSKIAQFFFVIPSMISSVLFPVVASGLTAELKLRIESISNKLLAGCSMVCGVLALTGYWLFPAIYGNSFDNMFIPFILTIPGILAYCKLYPYTAYFAGKNRISVNLRGSVWAVLVIITADIVLIPRFGVHGAAIGCSLAYFVYYFYVTSVFYKKQKS